MSHSDENYPRVQRLHATYAPSRLTPRPRLQLVDQVSQCLRAGSPRSLSGGCKAPGSRCWRLGGAAAAKHAALVGRGVRGPGAAASRFATASSSATHSDAKKVSLERHLERAYRRTLTAVFRYNRSLFLIAVSIFLCLAYKGNEVIGAVV